MTDQLSPELETRLQAWLAQRAPGEVPSALLERVAAIPRSTPTAATVRRAPVTDVGRRMRPLFAAAAVLILFGVVALGGLFVAASRHDAPLPSPSASATPTASATPFGATSLPSIIPPVISSGVLPVTIPDGVEHGTIDTPIGPARWVHLQGDKTTLPNPAPIRMPDGRIAWFQRGGPGAACFNDPTSTECTDPPAPAVQVSDDILASREPRPLPLEVAEADLRLIGDSFWFSTTDPPTVWRSVDLADWQRTDSSEVVPPGPASLDWAMSIAPVAVAGDATLATATFTAKDPGRLLGHPGVNVHPGTIDSGGFVAMQHRLRSEGGDIELGRITVDESSDGLRFLDASGLEVGRVEGVGREFVEDWARRGEIRDDRLATIDGQSWSLVELPGAQLADWPNVIPMDGSTMVFGTEPGGVRSWRTTDGKTWTGGDLLVDADGKALASSGLSYREDPAGIVLVAYGTDGTSFWRSTDGETWVLTLVDPTQPPVTVFEGGWLRTADQTEDGTWLASRDGTTFEEVPALKDVVDKLTPNGAGGSGAFAIGSTVFFMVEEEEAPFTRDVWLIEFEAPEP